MKYQQLENLECGWKWHYLVKKHKEGESITCYLEESRARQAIDELLQLENEPTRVLTWIKNNLHNDLQNRLNQSIRAKRKRYYNAEQLHTRKKSIDLDFMVWQRLANLAQHHSLTLSEMINYLITEVEHGEQAIHQMSSLKHDLEKLLK